MPFDAPLTAPPRKVLPEWIDYNGHMNVAFYSKAFDEALDDVMQPVGLSWDYVKTSGASYFVAESHITYLQEVKEGDPLRITFQLLDWDAKRVHYFMEMYHGEDGYLAATSEQIAIHVDMTARRASPFPEAIKANIAELWEAHKAMPKPPQVGHVIGIRRK